MNRGSTGIIIALIVVVILGIGGLYFVDIWNSRSDLQPIDTMPAPLRADSTTSNNPDSLNETLKEPTNTTIANAYVEYSPEALEQGVGKTRVLFFFANWCPTCIPVDTELQANVSEIPEGTIVYRVNYNDSDTDAEEEALAEKYGVTYQHTFVIIDDEGNEISKWNGGGLDRILSEL